MMTNPEVLEPATIPQAQAFYESAWDQIDQHLIIGEAEAKLGAIVAMASGLNVVLFGAPGGGKTTLGEYLPKLVEDIAPNQVAVIPPQADITPQLLIGGEIKTSKETKWNGDTTTERSSIQIDPIIHADTKVIWANEINRTNQFALNAALEALEAGKIDHSGGRVQLDLMWSASSMNPGEKQDGTFPITTAMASRHAIGATMGTGSDQHRKQITTEILRGWEPTPHKIRPVTDIETLKRIRNLTEAPDKIALPEQLLGFAHDLVDSTQAVLQEANISETDNRIAKHVRKISRTITALQGGEVVGRDELGWAARFVAAARLGMQKKDIQATSEELDKIYTAPGRN